MFVRMKLLTLKMGKIAIISTAIVAEANLNHFAFIVLNP